MWEWWHSVLIGCVAVVVVLVTVVLVLLVVRGVPLSPVTVQHYIPFPCRVSWFW